MEEAFFFLSCLVIFFLSMALCTLWTLRCAFSRLVRILFLWGFVFFCWAVIVDMIYILLVDE